MDWDKVGVKIDRRLLNNLRYADDIVLVGKNRLEIRRMAEELASECKKIGLGINFYKSKFLVKDKNEEDLVIQGSVIECVNEYKYFGQISKTVSKK